MSEETKIDLKSTWDGLQNDVKVSLLLLAKEKLVDNFITSAGSMVHDVNLFNLLYGYALQEVEKRQEEKRREEEKRQEEKRLEEEKRQEEKRQDANLINIENLLKQFNDNEKTSLKKLAAEGSENFCKNSKLINQAFNNEYFAMQMYGYVSNLVLAEQDIEDKFKEKTFNICGKDIHYKTIALTTGALFIFLGILCGILGCVFQSRIGTILTNISAIVMTAGTSSVTIFVMVYLVAHQVKKIENASNSRQQYEHVDTDEKKE